MAKKIVVHCRCHRMVPPAGGGRKGAAQRLTGYSRKERTAPSNRLRSFGPVTNKGTVAKYLSPSRDTVSRIPKNPPGPQGYSAWACGFTPQRQPRLLLQDSSEIG